MSLPNKNASKEIPEPAMNIAGFLLSSKESATKGNTLLFALFIVFFENFEKL